MSKFKVGDRVKCVYRYGGGIFAGRLVQGKFARVIVIDPPRYQDCIEVIWEDEELQAHAVLHFKDSYTGKIWGDAHWERGLAPLNPKKPLRHRDGSPVDMYFYDKDCPRPYVSSYKGLRLTFEESGLFYPSHESPCDLVNS